MVTVDWVAVAVWRGCKWSRQGKMQWCKKVVGDAVITLGMCQGGPNLQMVADWVEIWIAVGGGHAWR